MRYWTRLLGALAGLLFITAAVACGTAGAPEKAVAPAAERLAEVTVEKATAAPAAMPATESAGPAGPSGAAGSRGAAGPAGPSGEAELSGPAGPDSPPAAPAVPAAESSGTVSVTKELSAPVEVSVEKETMPTAVPAAAMDTEAAGDTGGEGAAESIAEYNSAPALTAGEVDDNQHWEDYLNYRRQYAGPPVNAVDISERYTITVLDARQRPVPNATVRVSIEENTPLFEGRTYANGQTLFFPRTFPTAAEAETFHLYAEAESVGQSLDFQRGEGTEWAVSLDLERTSGEQAPLDILFLLDATGSMADEIERIKATLLSIAARISDLPSQPDLRFGMVAYRDRGDTLVTRTFPFTRDIPSSPTPYERYRPMAATTRPSPSTRPCT